MLYSTVIVRSERNIENHERTADQRRVQDCPSPPDFAMTHVIPSSADVNGSDVDVSIIMAVYNSERFIADALNACLAQTGVKFEIIVSDDGSDQSMIPLVERICKGDPRVVTLRSPQNSGPAHARNQALRIAKGEFIAIVDSDDLVAPSRIARLVETARDTGADIVVDNLIEFSETPRGRQEKMFLSGSKAQFERAIDLTEYMRSGLKNDSRHSYGYLKPLIRRKSIEMGGFSYRQSVRISEDYYLLADMLRAGCRMLYIPQRGYYYRRHTGSLTHRAEAEHIRLIVDAEEAFRSQLEPALSEEQIRWSKRRSKVFRKMYQFERMAHFVKNHRYLDAFCTFIKRPPDMPSQVSRGLWLLVRKAMRP